MEHRARYRPWLAGLLSGFVVLGAAFAYRTPLWQAPDEPAHASYVHSVAESAFLPPVIGAGDWNATLLDELTSTRFGRDPEIGHRDHLAYEDHQPPLYYWLTAVPFWIGGGTRHACCEAGLYPHPEYVRRGTRSIRLAGLAFGLVTLALCAAALELAFASTTIAFGATAFIAFLPMYAYMSAVVNNDALADLVMAVALLAAARRLAGLTTRRRYVTFAGLIWGAALLTKLTVYPVILPLVVAEALRTRRDGAPIRDAVAPAAKSVGLGLLIGAPWFVRNMVVYGPMDPFGLAAHDRVVVGQPRTVDWIADHGWGGYLKQAVEWTFQSFWGKFGWMAAPMDRRIYVVLAVASVVMTIGFAGYARRAWMARSMDNAAADVGPLQRDVLVVFGLVVATTVGGYVWYNLTFVQHQGRYLFPALIPLATAAMLGIREWARWAARAAGRPSWAEGIALAGMVAFDGGLLATSVWALVHVIPTLWPGG